MQQEMQSPDENHVGDDNDAVLLGINRFLQITVKIYTLPMNICILYMWYESAIIIIIFTTLHKAFVLNSNSGWIG